MRCLAKQHILSSFNLSSRVNSSPPLIFFVFGGWALGLRNRVGGVSPVSLNFFQLDRPFRLKVPTAQKSIFHMGSCQAAGWALLRDTGFPVFLSQSSFLVISSNLMSGVIDLLYFQHETYSRGTKTRALGSDGTRTRPPPFLLTVNTGASVSSPWRFLPF